MTKDKKAGLKGGKKKRRRRKQERNQREKEDSKQIEDVNKKASREK